MIGIAAPCNRAGQLRIGAGAGSGPGSSVTRSVSPEVAERLGVRWV